APERPVHGQEPSRHGHTLAGTFATPTNLVAGRGLLFYRNRPAETPHPVWLPLDQNIFAPPPNSISRVLNLPPLLFAGGVVFDFSAKGFVGGITVDRFAANGRPLTTKVLGTMMRVELPRPLAPNLRVPFDVPWH